jgi:flagellar motor switch protein FliG
MAQAAKKRKQQEDYMTPTQKLAALMILLGEETAAEMIKSFDDNERELVCAEMANLPMMDQEQQGKVLQEFTEMAISASSGVTGSVDYTRRVLEKSVGLFKAAEIIGRVGTARTSVSTMQQIIDLDPVAICNLIKEEEPQTIALIISYLSAAKGSEVLILLPESVRELVVEKLATLESTPIEVVETLGEVLSSKVGERVSRALNQTGGEKSAAAVLNAMGKEHRADILNNIDERNPDLVRSIRMKMFTFDDLGTLDAKTLQTIMREVDASKLAMALSAATESLQKAMLGALSKRAAETVADEIENMGKVSLREIQANQNSIIDIVRQLESDGEISLESD